MQLQETIKDIESQIEKALWDLEINDKIKEALDAYHHAETKLLSLEITPDQPAFPEQQRVLSYCLMRQGNILRQLDKADEALALGEREISAAQASGDSLILARSLMSNGTNFIVTGNLSKGLELIEKAHGIFEAYTGYDYQQGLGWYWILQADLANAGLLKRNATEVIEITNRALDILMPIENWPGVARAYSARAVAHRQLGNGAEAEKDHAEQEYYESQIKSDDNNVG